MRTFATFKGSCARATASCTVIFCAIASPLFSADKPLAGVHEIHNDADRLKRDKSAIVFNLSPDMTIGEEESDDTNALFGDVYDIAVDYQYSIYVVDNGFGRVQVYDSTGAYVRVLGRLGEGPGEYRSPSAVATDEDGNVYVAGQSKVIKYDSEGVLAGELKHGKTSFTRSVQVSRGILFLSLFDVFDQLIVHRYDWSSGSYLSSFCDSYAVGQRIDTRVEMVLAGGTVKIDGEVLYYSQLCPYEIRMFSLDGSLRTIVYRANDFVFAPAVEMNRDGTMHFGRYGACVSVLPLRRGGFLNVAISPGDKTDYRTVIDMFDSEGHLIGSKQLADRFIVRCRDDRDRLYAVDLSSAPKIVRCKLVIR